MSSSIATPTSAHGLETHPAFDASIDRIDATLRHHFRRWPSHHREEAIAEARAYTWAAWLGLIRRDEDPVTVGVVAIAANCCRAVANGRSVGTRKATGRGAMDIHNPKARRLAGVRVFPLAELSCSSPGDWQDWIASDDRYGPAEEAAFRVDFASWIGGLTTKRRRVAELLAEGLGTWGPGRWPAASGSRPARQVRLATGWPGPGTGSRNSAARWDDLCPVAYSVFGTSCLSRTHPSHQWSSAFPMSVDRDPDSLVQPASTHAAGRCSSRGNRKVRTVRPRPPAAGPYPHLRSSSIHRS